MSDNDKLAWITLNDKRVLCVRSKNQDFFYLPGGKRDQDETDAIALVREIYEELSVDLIPSTITLACVFTAPAQDQSTKTPVKITCYFSQFKGAFEVNGEIEEVAWLNYHNKSKCSPVTKIIMDWLYENNLIE